MKDIHLRPPTNRQAQVLAAIASSLIARGVPATYVEIGELTGIRGQSFIKECLRGLEKRNLIIRHGKGRGGATLTPRGMALALHQMPCAACNGTGRVPMAPTASTAQGVA